MEQHHHRGGGGGGGGGHRGGGHRGGRGMHQGAPQGYDAGPPSGGGGAPQYTQFQQPEYQGAQQYQGQTHYQGGMHRPRYSHTILRHKLTYNTRPTADSSTPVPKPTATTPPKVTAHRHQLRGLPTCTPRLSAGRFERRAVPQLQRLLQRPRLSSDHARRQPHRPSRPFLP